MDEFGRQTPVLTSDSGVFKTTQDLADFATQFSVKITSNPPAFAKTYKYFVKEISAPTHNFLADSFYQDKEGFIYIAIPSADVNKVDIDDSIILKKKRGNNVSDITQEFKVLDKYTTAPPPFLAKPLKEIYVPDVFVFSRDFEQDRDQHVIKPGSTPVPGRNRVTISAMFRMRENHVESGEVMKSLTTDGISSQINALLIPGAKVKFVTASGETDIYTIAIKEIDLKNDNDCELHFTEEFGDDVKILYEDYDLNPFTATLVGGLAHLDNTDNSYSGGVKMVVVDTADESGKEEYQGKFFIKVKNDSVLLEQLKGEEDINNLQVLSTISLDGNPADNDDHRALHVYAGGKKLTDSSVTRQGLSGTLQPSAGGFGETAFNAASMTYKVGGSVANHQGINFTTILDEGYHLALRTDRPYGDVDSHYGTLPFLTALQKAPSNKNNYNTDNDVYMVFDRSLKQIADGQPVDNTKYKVIRVFKYLELDGSGSGDFGNGDAVYFIKFDQQLKQDTIFQGMIDTATNSNGSPENIMQMSTLEFRKSDQLIGIPEPPIFEVLPKDDVDIDIYFETQEVFSCSTSSVHGQDNLLSYYNCFSFGNGVESFAIRDLFNGAQLGKGVRVSTVFEDKPYVEETLKNSLIFSQIYNNKNSLNRLNQFIIAEDITKEVNPDYGSIQLLHTRYNDIIAYCENKVVKILTNKDALFNADGNVNVTSNKAVLGQAIPYNSNFGISKNPESFAAYTHRSYFTDRKNGVVVRHSMDGMEAISGYGMKDFFRDSLAINNGLMVGSYDVKKHQYNISTHETNANSTVSFSESTNGWVSRKSFIPEAGFSLENKYFTFKNGHIFEHHVNTTHGNFYGSQSTPYVEFLLNEAPANMKNFRTLNYEGDLGWTCSSITTDQQDGDISAFIQKENKYFNYIKGIEETETTLDPKALNVQGIGTWNSRNAALASVTLTVDAGIPPELQIGDKLYEYDREYNLIGTITGKSATTVTASTDGTGESAGSSSAVYILYVKDARWQTSGLLGYFAKVKMQNTATTSKEIYSVGSEISISS